MTAEARGPVDEFIVAAVVPRAGSPFGGSHADGGTGPADAVLARHPEVATANIHAAAILGDAEAVLRFIAADPASATAKGGPYEWDALTHLCFSNYLKRDARDHARSAGFVRASTALLDAGASANTGWFAPEDFPHPQWEPALYGACGVAHHAELTQLLVERGANVNDDEVAYHAPEGFDNAALRILVASGQLSAESLGLMLIRKIDWHDAEGLRMLLESGASAARARERGWRALHHALARCNGMEVIALLLDHGADPLTVDDGMSAVVRAAHEGRHDVLAEFERRGVSLAVTGVDRLLMALARGDDATIADVQAREPTLVAQVVAASGEYLSKFMNAGNHDGLRRLLDLGVPATAPYAGGDGYFSIPDGALPIHIAAWFLDTTAIRLLIERGADVNAAHANGMTPLSLVVLGCTESYWSEWRSPEPARALIEAGASLQGVPFPCGYGELDALLKAHGATPFTPPRRHP